jgi:DNA-binding NarL/FixJ family response regulator
MKHETKHKDELAITVFLADDHAVVRDGLKFLLGAQPDISVIGDAANGRQAVRRVARLRPDVAVMDIAMPELNGIEATREIRQVCPSTQVIILSMHSTTEHVFQALEAGARGYLLKESAGIEVVAAVRAVHAGHRYLSQRISDRLIDDYVRQRQAAETESPLARLSPREREVLQLVVEGKTSAQIAAILSLSLKTVETYRSRMMQKLGISDLPGLVKFAIQHGLTPLE